MPSAPSSSKARAKATLTAEGDHRKRRRNRTTQSCLNCHATKRMCDRKRPCSRCSQLGLTGNLFLLFRSSSIKPPIPQLKNKPHPRWLAEKDQASSSDGSHPSPSSSAGPSTPRFPTWALPSSSCSTPPSFLSHARGNPSPSHTRKTHSFLPCACYIAVLELSARLRWAAETLGRSPSHANNSNCGLNARISALDTLASTDSLLLREHAISPALFDDFYANNDP
ncbi:hypothetical protein K438DRAFT_1868286, partial [Mycena galopus ATCC 62051]